MSDRRNLSRIGYMYHGDAYMTSFKMFLGSIANSIQNKWDIDLTDQSEYEVEEEVIQLIEDGKRETFEDYNESNIVRTNLVREIDAIFDEHEILITPTLATPPFARDAEGPEMDHSAESGIELDSLEWNMNWFFNMTGHPVASLPAGFTSDGLPIGLQVVGRRLADDSVLAASAAYESIEPWNRRYPPKRPEN